MEFVCMGKFRRQERRNLHVHGTHSHSVKDSGMIVKFKIDYLIYSVNELAKAMTTSSRPDLTSKTSSCNSTKCLNHNQCTISVTTS